jgi:predicted dienelactone hydrolase
MRRLDVIRAMNGKLHMRWFKLLLAATACFATTLAQAAGVQFITVPADIQGPKLTGAVWTPCAESAQEVKLRGVTAPGVMSCPIVGDSLALVVVSHGKAGWFGAYHDTAETLADAGFVVAAINHPGDNAFEASRTITSNAITRPNDIKRLIDFMLKAWPDASKLNPERIGFFGHSAGGYTGLVIAGGRPDLQRAADLCAKGLRPGSPPCEQYRNVDMPEQTPISDPRVKAVVIADPGNTIFFGPDDLKEVKVPIQLWSSALGGAGVTVESVANVDRKLPSKADYQIVPNARHWSFLAPCSPEQARAYPTACVDAPGFDRVTFHEHLHAGMIAFFSRYLVEGEKP